MSARKVEPPITPPFSIAEYIIQRWFGNLLGLSPGVVISYTLTHTPLSLAIEWTNSRTR